MANIKNWNSKRIIQIKTTQFLYTKLAGSFFIIFKFILNLWDYVKKCMLMLHGGVFKPPEKAVWPYEEPLKHPNSLINNSLLGKYPKG